MKNKKNIAEKYFKQKDFSVIEIILCVVILIAAIIATFVQGGGPIGLPLLACSIVILVICRSFKIKDAEFDQAFQSIMIENGLEYTDNTVTGYQLNDTAVKKRRDGKLISSQYYITNIVKKSEENVEFNICIVDLIAGKIKKETYISHPKEVFLVNQTIKVPMGQRNVSYIRIKTCDYLIPITLDDYKTSQLIELVCRGYEEI